MMRRLRLLYFWLLIGVTSLSSACLSREVPVPLLLPTVRDATVEELVDTINQQQSVRTLTARFDVNFESERDIDRGLSRRWRSAEGLLVLARSGKIYLQIQAPVVKTNITELASDGQKFQLIVHPREYRTYIQGTNDRRYTNDAGDVTLDDWGPEATAFSRVRPQHFTEAFFLPPIDPADPHTLVVKKEFRREEEDTRPNVPRGSRIIKTYTILLVIGRASESDPVLRREYWFDRTRDLVLAREQLYGQAGELLADISFDAVMPSSGQAGFLPTKIHIHRPHDYYRVTMSLHPSTLKLNMDVLEQAFRLKKPDGWDDVRTIDLDENRKTP